MTRSMRPCSWAPSAPRSWTSEVIQSWRKNPMGYVGMAGNAVDLLMKRTFAPPVARLLIRHRAAARRPRSAPSPCARTSPILPGSSPTWRCGSPAGPWGSSTDDVAKWARESAGTDTAALRAFTAVNDSVVSAMAAAAAWLKTDLLRALARLAPPSAPRRLRTSSATTEMVDIPWTGCSRWARPIWRKTIGHSSPPRQEVAPGATPQQAMAALEADHPSAATLLPSTSRRRSTARGQFLIDHQIGGSSSPTCAPIVAETPPYARVGTFASMDTPGAYEQNATEAFYYVTPPEADWDSAHVEEHLRLYNGNVMSIITIHEAFPGHYLQFIYAKQFPTKTRKLLYANTNVEGWAHYGEQMMVEEGFGNGNPRIRLAQLSEAAAARLPLGGRDQGAYAGPVGGRRRQAVLHRPVLPAARQRVRRGAPWHARSDLPLLHAGETRDLQAPRATIARRKAPASRCVSSTTSSSGRAASRSS